MAPGGGNRGAGGRLLRGENTELFKFIRKLNQAARSAAAENGFDLGVLLAVNHEGCRYDGFPVDAQAAAAKAPAGGAAATGAAQAEAL